MSNWAKATGLVLGPPAVPVLVTLIFGAEGLITLVFVFLGLVAAGLVVAYIMTAKGWLDARDRRRKAVTPVASVPESEPLESRLVERYRSAAEQRYGSVSELRYDTVTQVIEMTDDRT